MTPSDLTTLTTPTTVHPPGPPVEGLRAISAGDCRGLPEKRFPDGDVPGYAYRFR